MIKDLVSDSKHIFHVDELHEKTGIPMKRIIKFIRQGRLQFANIGSVLVCESCGEQVEEGRYCSTCKAKMLQGLHGENAQSELEETDTKSSPQRSRMFLADLTGKKRR
jgi:hypothetical protein